jgi:hypothetical protein
MVQYYLFSFSEKLLIYLLCMFSSYYKSCYVCTILKSYTTFKYQLLNVIYIMCICQPNGNTSGLN